MKKRLCIVLLLFVYFGMFCTDDNKLFKPTGNSYSIKVSIIDSSSGESIIDTIYPGQRLCFNGIIVDGDPSKIDPYWTIGTYKDSSFTVTRSLDIPGECHVTFSIKDKAGFSIEDSLTLYVKKLDSAMICGKAFLFNEKDSRTIKVRLTRINDNYTVSYFTDSSGVYASKKNIPSGTYTIYDSVIQSNYSFSSKNISNVKIIDGQINRLSDVTLYWPYEISVTDTQSNKPISNNHTITAGQKLLFKCKLNSGDSTKVIPFWSIVNSDSGKIKGFSFNRSFKDIGNYKIIFTLADSFNTPLEDTISINVIKIKNGGGISGKVTLKGKLNNRNISIYLKNSTASVPIIYSDSVGGFYVDGIPSGLYNALFYDSTTNSEYINKSQDSITITNGLLTELESVILNDTTAPFFYNFLPSTVIPGNILSFYTLFRDQGSGIDSSTLQLFMNDSIVMRTSYDLSLSGLKYKQFLQPGEYRIKVSIKDSALNSSKKEWSFLLVDTNKVRILHPQDSLELSINDTIMFAPSNDWFVNKTHKYKIEIKNEQKRIIDSLTAGNAVIQLKNTGLYKIRFEDIYNGRILNTDSSTVKVLMDTPVIKLMGDTVAAMDTILKLKVNVQQKFGKIIKYEWKCNDSILQEDDSTVNYMTPGLPKKDVLFKVTCTDDDGNIGTDSMRVTFGLWESLGKRGFSDPSKAHQIVLNNDTPYVAFLINSYPSYIACMKYTNNEWIGAGDKPASEHCINFSLSTSSKAPAIAYTSFSNMYGFYLKWLNGNKWENRTDELTWWDTNVYDWNIISMTYIMDIPYIAVTNGIDEGNKACLIRCINNQWDKAINLPCSYGMASCLILKSLDSIPYLAFKDSFSNENNIRCKKLQNGIWQDVGNQIETGSSLSFCFNERFPCIGYISAVDNHVNVKEFSSGVWNNLDTISSSTSDNMTICSFRGKLFSVYNDKTIGRKAVVKMFDGKKWQTAGVISDGAANYFAMTSDQNHLYVVYSDDNQHGGTTVMRLK